LNEQSFVAINIISENVQFQGGIGGQRTVDVVSGNSMLVHNVVGGTASENSCSRGEREKRNGRCSIT